MLTPLVPHGEGFVMFFDCWGIAREDKVLYVTIQCCRHLNPTNYGTCDPYCEINCNGKSTKLADTRLLN